MVNATELQPVAVVTAACMAWYYVSNMVFPVVSMFFYGVADQLKQAGVKLKLVNMNEQGPPFLICLWLHAVFVSVEDAAFFGSWCLFLTAMYIPSELSYVFAWGVPPLELGCFFTLFPLYLINLYLALSVVFGLGRAFDDVARQEVHDGVRPRGLSEQIQAVEADTMKFYVLCICTPILFFHIVWTFVSICMFIFRLVGAALMYILASGKEKKK